MGKFGDQLIGAGIEAGQGIVQAGMGLALSRSQDQRQLNMQRKLQHLQIQGQQHMLDRNTEAQLKMWKDTNYGPQMEQLKAAGLNPGLIYGMSGGGGATANIQPGNVTGGQAPHGGGEIQTMLGMGIQRELLQAQKENIQADTANKLASNPNIPKEGKLIDAQTSSLLQGIDNAKTQKELMEIEASILGVKYEIDAQTQNHIISNIKKGAAIIANDEEISTATKEDKIKIIQAEAIGATLTNALTKEQTGLTTQHTAESKARVIQIGQDIMQKWTGLNLEQQKVLIQEEMTKIAGGHLKKEVAMAKLEALHRTFNQIMKFREMPSLPLGVPPIQ